MIDVLGYLGMVICLISFFIKNMHTFRIVNTVSCIIFAIYGCLLGTYPIVFLNIAVIITNVYFIVRKK